MRRLWDVPVQHLYMPLKPEGYVVDKRGIVSAISDDDESEDEKEVIDLITSDEE